MQLEGSRQTKLGCLPPVLNTSVRYPKGMGIGMGPIPSARQTLRHEVVLYAPWIYPYSEDGVECNFANFKSLCAWPDKLLAMRICSACLRFFCIQERGGGHWSVLFSAMESAACDFRFLVKSRRFHVSMHWVLLHVLWVLLYVSMPWVLL